VAGVTIGGSLVGGAGGESGTVYIDDDLGVVKVGHDVQGGSGAGSGRIFTDANFAGLSIGGSLVVGSGPDSGLISSDLDLGVVRIGHDLTGGSIVGATALDRSGVIKSDGRIAGVTIGGSIVSGIDTSTGPLRHDSHIRHFLPDRSRQLYKPHRPAGPSV
jgi:hypothetical protein